MMNSPFWLNDITILFKKDRIIDFSLSHNKSLEEKLNTITRIVFLLSIIGYVITKNFKIIISLIVTLIVIIMLYKYQIKQEFKNKHKLLLKEGFKNKEFYEAVKNNYTTPVKNNPFMNVLPNDNLNNPKRKAAAPIFNETVENDVYDKVKEGLDPKLFRDLGDNLEFEQSMRNFYTMPNTQIPNDQKAFAEFCYGNMKSCKQGDEIQCEKKNYRHINQ